MLFQPIAAACKPGSTRVDVFALAPDTTGAHVPHWLRIDSAGGITSWQSLGGDGQGIVATWLGDASELIAYLHGNDNRFWTNALNPATNTWSGWRSNPDGALHGIVIAST